MCMYVRMDYPCMYLCIYFYNICTIICNVQVSGEKKNYGCHWNFYLSFSLRQYYGMLSFAALRISPLHKV